MITMSELASDPIGPAATRARDELGIGAKPGDENNVDGTAPAGGAMVPGTVTMRAPASKTTQWPTHNQLQHNR